MNITICGEDDKNRPVKFWRPDWRDLDAKAAESEHEFISGWLQRHVVQDYSVSTIKVDKSPADPRGYYIEVVLYGHNGAIPEHYPVRVLAGNIRINYTLK